MFWLHSCKCYFIKLISILCDIDLLLMLCVRVLLYEFGQFCVNATSSYSGGNIPEIAQRKTATLQPHKLAHL